eukprot:UN24286
MQSTSIIEDFDQDLILGFGRVFAVSLASLQRKHLLKNVHEKIVFRFS